MAENWMNEYVYDSIKYGTGMMRAATDGMKSGMKDMFKDAGKVREQYSKMRLNFGPPAPTAHELITRTNSDWVKDNPMVVNWLQYMRWTDTEIYWLGRPNGHYQWGMDLATGQDDWCATVFKKEGRNQPEINPK